MKEKFALDVTTEDRYVSRSDMKRTEEETIALLIQLNEALLEFERLWMSAVAALPQEKNLPK
jgi:hypothetical protein